MEEQQLYGWSEYADEFAYEIDVSAAIQDPFTSQGDHDGKVTDDDTDDDTDDKKVSQGTNEELQILMDQFLEEQSDDDTDDKKVATDDDTDDDDGLDVGLEQDERWNAEYEYGLYGSDGDPGTDDNDTQDDDDEI